MAFEVVTQCAHDRDAGESGTTSLLTHDQIGVAVAHARIFIHFREAHRQRTQGLGDHAPAVGHDRELTTAGGDHSASEADEVAEVNIGFPFVETFFADDGCRQHGLQLGAVAFLDGGKAQFAGITHEHQATDDGDGVVSFFTGSQVADGGSVLVGFRLTSAFVVDAVLVANLGEGVVALDLHRVGINTLLEQSAAFLQPDLNLFRYLIRGLGGLCGRGVSG